MKTHRIFYIMFFMTLVCYSAIGQPQRNRYDFRFIQDTNPWLTSSNAAGLGTMQTDRTAVINVFFKKDDGSLIGLEESPNSIQAGTYTEAYVKASDKLSLYGKLSYSFFNGKNMGGPVFMNPSYNPINFYEDATDNLGDKNRELFAVNGGISYNFNGKWSIGGRADYESGYYVKLKDPRFQNDLMNLNVSLGGRFSPSEKFSAGINGIFRNTVETPLSDLFGIVDKQYFTFIDYGGFFGTRESLEGDNAILIHGKDLEAAPMSNLFYGASLQIEAGSRVKVFNELTFLVRDGSYGKKASSSVMYFEFGGNIMSYSGDLLVNGTDNIHKVHLGASYETLRNYENVYRITTPTGGMSVVEYFGQNEVQQMIEINGNLSYTGYLGIEHFRPSWEYGVKMDSWYRTVLTSIYPYYRLQKITNFNAGIFGRKNFTVGQNIFTVGLEAGFFMGFGTPKQDGAYADAVSDAPRSHDHYLYRDFEFKTAQRANAMLAFRYTRLFRKNFAVYIDVSDRYTHAVQALKNIAGPDRNEFIVTLGCAF